VLRASCLAAIATVTMAGCGSSSMVATSQSSVSHDTASTRTTVRPNVSGPLASTPAACALLTTARAQYVLPGAERVPNPGDNTICAYKVAPSDSTEAVALSIVADRPHYLSEVIAAAAKASGAKPIGGLGDRAVCGGGVIAPEVNAVSLSMQRGSTGFGLAESGPGSVTDICPRLEHIAREINAGLH
jgi:hypothetical protein